MDRNIIKESINQTIMNKLMRILGGLGAGLMALALVWAPVSYSVAAEFVVPDESGNVTLSASETHKNLYVAGGNVLVNSPTTGDLYVAGGNITVEGSVEGDLTVAGGSIYINGSVGGDVRIAGGEITINNTVGGDVVMAGGTLTLTEKAPVGGDVYIAGGEVTVGGPVSGKLGVSSGMVTINSAIAGEVKITATEKLTLGEKAVLGTSANYKSWQEAEVRDGAQVGGLKYEQIARHDKRGGAAVAGVMTIGFIIKLLAMILAALILIKLFPKKSYQLVGKYIEQVWSNLGIGFVGIIAAPIVAIILLITAVGFYAGLMLLLIWLVWCFASVLVGMVSVGAWINQKLIKKAELTVDWQAVVIGVVVMSLASMVPVIGWLVMALVMFAGFGTIIRHIAAIIRDQQASVISN